MNGQYEEQAFPTSEENNDGSLDCARSRGMSLRAWFAGLAMQGLLSNTELSMGNAELAKFAVMQAQALINELNETS